MSGWWRLAYAASFVVFAIGFGLGALVLAAYLLGAPGEPYSSLVAVAANGALMWRYRSGRISQEDG